MPLHPTFLVTVEQRFAAVEAERVYRDAGDVFAPIAQAIGMARYAESFPNSYTTAAVELSERVIRRAAGRIAGRHGDLEALAVEVEALRSAGRWYRD